MIVGVEKLRVGLPWLEFTGISRALIGVRFVRVATATQRLMVIRVEESWVVGALNGADVVDQLSERRPLHRQAPRTQRILREVQRRRPLPPRTIPARSRGRATVNPRDRRRGNPRAGSNSWWTLRHFRERCDRGTQ
jgi:hypothetical protein